MLMFNEFGADGENRTPKTFRPLEPKSNPVATRGEPEQEFQLLNKDTLAPLGPSSDATGHNLGTVLAGEDPILCADQMRDIFFSSDGWERAADSDFERVAGHLASGHFAVSWFEYDHSTAPTRGKLLDAYFWSQHSGSKEHQGLKWNAYNLLKTLGSPEPWFEQMWAHGRCDASCYSLGITVECGDTHPGNVYLALDSKFTREFWMLPFDYGRGGRPPIAYRFRRGPNFSYSGYSFWKPRFLPATLPPDPPQTPIQISTEVAS